MGRRRASQRGDYGATAPIRLSLFVMARLVRAIHNPLTVWMARIKRAMTMELFPLAVKRRHQGDQAEQADHNTGSDPFQAHGDSNAPKRTWPQTLVCGQVVSLLLEQAQI